MRRGETDAQRAARFEELALPQMQGLYNLAFHLAGNEADAEDLVQEAYLKSFRSFARFQPGTNFRAWIYRILRNTFINQYHKQKLRNHADLDTVENTLTRGHEDDRLLARIDTTGDLFQNALRTLPEVARTMLVLAYVDGFSYREIAEITQSPVGTVMSRLHRARRHLRRHLEAQPPQPSNSPSHPTPARAA